VSYHAKLVFRRLLQDFHEGLQRPDTFRGEIRRDWHGGSIYRTGVAGEKRTGPKCTVGEREIERQGSQSEEE
jgi:hypothetical protein